MAVAININMPQNCTECPISHTEYTHEGLKRVCGLLAKYCGYESDRVMLDDCPLMELTDGLYQAQGERIWKYQGKGKR